MLMQYPRLGSVTVTRDVGVLSSRILSSFAHAVLLVAAGRVSQIDACGVRCGTQEEGELTREDASFSGFLPFTALTESTSPVTMGTSSVRFSREPDAAHGLSTSEHESTGAELFVPARNIAGWSARSLHGAASDRIGE
jgi:hypothetical protein